MSWFGGSLPPSGGVLLGNLQLGGTTSAFPMLKRNGTSVDFRLADDSAYAPIRAGGTSEIYLDASGVQELLVRTSGDAIMRQDAYTTQFNGGINHTLLFFEAKMDAGVGAGFLFGSGRDANGTSNSVDAFAPSTSVNAAHATFRSAFTPSANAPNFVGLQVNPTINGTSTGTATALAIASKTNTLTGGTVWLLDAGTTTTDYFTGYTRKMGIDTAGLLNWIAANAQTTVGAAGGASALPATPTKYLKVKDSAGTTLVVPAYAAT